MPSGLVRGLSNGALFLLLLLPEFHAAHWHSFLRTVHGRAAASIRLLSLKSFVGVVDASTQASARFLSTSDRFSACPSFVERSELKAHFQRALTYMKWKALL